jgi:pyruvate formate lyase activating enzyme
MSKKTQKARFYESVANDVVRCFLCPKHCHIAEGKTGFCSVRKNVDGILISLNYGVCNLGILDPIEKKPLRHFMPGSPIFSVGSLGCNFSCLFCQNHEFVHGGQQLVTVTPEAVVLHALKLKGESNNIGIAYTYSEPTVWYEFVYDTAVLARKAGLKNVLVTNGYIEQAPLAALLPYIDAMNIDVKAFRGTFYREVCCGELEQVKQTVILAVPQTHVEITTLVIPGLNDSPDEIKALARWLGELSPQITLHLTRYFPCNKMTIPATPVATLEHLQNIASHYLQHVYLGNV